MSAAKKSDFLTIRKLLFVDSETGETKSVTVKLGQPYWTEEGVEAACPVLIEGMLSRQSDIYGIDFLNAIELAIQFINTYLACHAGQLRWSSGEVYED